MRNSTKININVSKILNYKSIILGSGSIMSLSERLDGCEIVVVDETMDEINELIFKLGTQLDIKSPPTRAQIASQRT